MYIYIHIYVYHDWLRKCAAVADVGRICIAWGLGLGFRVYRVDCAMGFGFRVEPC